MAEHHCPVSSEEFEAIWEGRSHAVLFEFDKNKKCPVLAGDTLWLKPVQKALRSVHVLVTHVTHHKSLVIAHFQHMHRGGRLCCEVARQDERVEAPAGAADLSRPLHLVWDGES